MEKIVRCPFSGGVCNDECGIYDEELLECGILSVADEVSRLRHALSKERKNDE